MYDLYDFEFDLRKKIMCIGKSNIFDFEFDFDFNF